MPPKRPTPAARRRLIRQAVLAAVDAASPAEMKRIFQELINLTSSISSAVPHEREDDRGELVVMWAKPATLTLMQAVADYAEHTQRPIEEVAYETLLRIGPHVGSPVRWN